MPCRVVRQRQRKNHRDVIFSSLVQVPRYPLEGCESCERHVAATNNTGNRQVKAFGEKFFCLLLQGETLSSKIRDTFVKAACYKNRQVLKYIVVLNKTGFLCCVIKS